MSKYKNVELSNIDLKENFRLRESEDDVASLMSTIKTEGLLNPVTVKAGKDGRYELLAGFRRFAAVKKLGHSEIAVNVIDKKSNSIIVNQIENLQRQDTSTYEIGRGIVVLKEEYSMSNDEVATRLGLKVSAVKAALEIYNDTPPEYRSIVKRLPGGSGARAGIIPNSVAAAIIGLRKRGIINVTQTKRLFSDVKKDGNITARQIADIGKKIKAGDLTSVAELTKSAKSVKTVQVYFKIKVSDLNRINREFEGGFHGATRDLVSDYFGIKLGVK